MLKNASKVFLFSGTNAIVGLLFFILLSRRFDGSLLSSLLFVDILIRLIPHFSMLGSDQVALKDKVNGINNYGTVFAIGVITSCLFLLLLSVFFVEVGFLLYLTIVSEIFVKINIDRYRAEGEWINFGRIFFWRRQVLIGLLSLLALSDMLTINLYLVVFILVNTIFTLPCVSVLHDLNSDIYQKILEMLRRGKALIPHIVCLFLLMNIDKYYVKYFLSVDDNVDYFSYFKVAGLLVLFIQTFNLMWMPYALKRSNNINFKKILGYVLIGLLFLWFALYFLVAIGAEYMEIILKISSINTNVLLVILVAVSLEILGELGVYKLHECEAYRQIAISSSLGLFTLVCGLSISSSLLGIGISFLLGIAVYNLLRMYFSLRLCW